MTDKELTDTDNCHQLMMLMLMFVVGSHSYSAELGTVSVQLTAVNGRRHAPSQYPEHRLRALTHS